ncbi:hypothetical protein Q31b_07480 [Novipirellula aureliae]|uniref:Uncharacterized protein n=1 Tax=Novipirellula aureliae TaxID=2527966 RepID=A0A5C6E7F4_9BACT|nr:hypothetical protein [Novipirellula aureliae]TWU45573.1 hypothetical protein Q31b_07480 [Novipirellula aureliae]
MTFLSFAFLSLVMVAMSGITSAAGSSPQIYEVRSYVLEKVPRYHGAVSHIDKFILTPKPYSPM